MASLLPINIPSIPTATIASYDYTDIAEGRGVVVFQGFQSGVQGSDAWHLAQTTITSHDIETNTTSLTLNAGAFNLPKRVKGTAYIRFSAALTGNPASSTFTATIYHVDAGGQTSIGTANPETIASAGGVKKVQNEVVPITIALTKFKKGEWIRVIITASHADTWIAHDPANREGGQVTPAATYPTKFEVHIPFVIP